MSKIKKDFEIQILSYFDPNAADPDGWVVSDDKYIDLLKNCLEKDKIDCLITLGESYAGQWSVSVSKIDLEKTIELLKAEKHSRIKYREVNTEGSEYVKIGFHF